MNNATAIGRAVLTFILALGVWAILDHYNGTAFTYKMLSLGGVICQSTFLGGITGLIMGYFTAQERMKEENIPPSHVNGICTFISGSAIFFMGLSITFTINEVLKHHGEHRMATFIWCAGIILTFAIVVKVCKDHLKPFVAKEEDEDRHSLEEAGGCLDEAGEILESMREDMLGMVEDMDFSDVESCLEGAQEALDEMKDPENAQRIQGSIRKVEGEVTRLKGLLEALKLELKPKEVEDG